MVHHPPEAKEAVADSLTWIEEQFPLLVDELDGVGPADPTIHVILSADPRVGALADCHRVYNVITVYLRRMNGRPSSVLAHEMIHAIVRGRAPRYLEEGLAYAMQERMLWRTGAASTPATITADAGNLDTALFSVPSYSPTEGSVGAGHAEARYLALVLERTRRESGVKLAAEMIRHLRDPRATVQTAVCRSPHGEALFAFLREAGLATKLASPSACGHLKPLAQAVLPDTWRWAAFTLVVTVALITLPAAACFVSLGCLALVGQSLIATGAPWTALVIRFGPAFVAGILSGALVPRAGLAAQGARPWPQTAVARLATNTIVLLPMVGTAASLYGPALMPYYFTHTACHALGLFAAGYGLLAPVALWETRRAIALWDVYVAPGRRATRSVNPPGL